MAILLNDNIRIGAGLALDSRYGPYANTAAAIAAIPTSTRSQGLLIGIISGGVLSEYYFKNGVADDDLILKIGALTNGTNNILTV